MTFSRNILLVSLLFSTIEANDEFGAFLNDLNEIATKTKQNVDHMPSTVTVLHASDLRELGANTIYDALSFVPGIETSMIHNGWKRLITRGLHNPDSFVFDKMKLFIDGANVSSRLFGTIYYYMDFPLDLVERIEVLRGAASALYGDGAYNGAINVITKSSQKDTSKEAHVSYGSNNYASLSAISSFTTDDFNFAIDAYGQKDDTHVNLSPNFVFNPATFTSKTRTNEELNNYGFGMKLSNEAFDATIRYNRYKSGNYFGLSQFLEPEPDEDSNQVDTLIAKVNHSFEISKDISMKNSLEAQQMSYKIGSTTLQAVPAWGISYDVGFGQDYRELSFAYNGEIAVNKFDKHSILIGIEADTTDVKSNKFWSNVINDTTSPFGFSYIDNGNFSSFNNDGIVTDASRDHFGIYFQDIYDVSEKLALSMNVRYDDFKKFDSDWNFRFGGVYEVNDEITLKAQYAESFRVPSFTEAFQTYQFGLRDGNPNLDNEKQKSYEFSIIAEPTPSQVIRLNSYYSKYSNTIDILSTPVPGIALDYLTYTNSQKRRSYGFELEYKNQLSDSDKFALLYSYTSSTYIVPYATQDKIDTPSMANHLAKLYLMHKISDRWDLNPTISYVGKRDSQFSPIPNAPIYDLDDYIIANISTNYEIKDGLKLQLSINDIFNEQAIVPSSRNQYPYLPRDGRTVLASIHFNF